VLQQEDFGHVCMSAMKVDVLKYAHNYGEHCEYCSVATATASWKNSTITFSWQTIHVWANIMRGELGSAHTSVC